MTEKPTVQQIQNWDKRYQLDKEDTSKVIDTKTGGEYWTVHPNEAYNLCIDLNNLVEENEQLKSDLQNLQDSLWTTEKIRELEKENEQLKQENKKLADALTVYFQSKIKGDVE